MNKILPILVCLGMITGCTRDVSPKQIQLEKLTAQNEALGLEMVSAENAEVILRCESVVANFSDGITVRLRPIEVLKGKLSDDMLNSAGELDFEKIFENDVRVPKHYIIYLRKENAVQNVDELMPFRMRYDFTLINDDQI